METTNHDFSTNQGVLDSLAPAMRNAQYTFPTYSEASQSNILFNPVTGFRLGVPTAEFLATSCPPTIVDIRPNTAARLPGWQVFNLARRLVEVFRNIERIAGLPADWDSFGSGRAAPIAVNIARNLVWNVVVKLAAQGVDATPYDVAPLSGRGVQLEWRGDAGTIQVEVSGEGRLGYLLFRGEDAPRETEEADDVSESHIMALISSLI
jgi:hypothetical protein